MAKAQLSLSQAASIELARQHADDTTRKAIKRDIFAAAKQAYGIPATTKLKCEVLDQTNADYLVLKDSATSAPFVLDPNTGLWLGAQVVPAPPQAKKWFRIPADQVVDALTNYLEDGVYGEATSSEPLPPTAVEKINGLAMDADGNAFVYLDADHFTMQ